MAAAVHKSILSVLASEVERFSIAVAIVVTLIISESHRMVGFPTITPPFSAPSVQVGSCSLAVGFCAKLEGIS